MMVPGDMAGRVAQWFVFSEWENGRYDMQRRFADHRLFWAEDALDLYSNHSQKHVTEVMEQCVQLFDAGREWIRSRLPESDAGELMNHLLAAAKYHDICMAPSEEMMEILAIVDQMYALALAAGRSFEEIRRTYGRLEKLMKGVMPASRSCMVVGILCRMAEPTPEAWTRLREALLRCHDEAKQYVRKNHARLSALFVLDNAAGIRERYGGEMDFSLVAAVIALHSLSSSGCKVIDDEEAESRAAVRAHIGALLAQRDLQTPVQDRWMKEVITLASILRLADARRSGARLTAIDGVRLGCEVKDGQVGLYRYDDGLKERITSRMSCEILLAECCSEFDGFAVEKCGSDWMFSHRLRVKDWQHEAVWGAFLQYRLAAYMQEIEGGVFRRRRGIRHHIGLYLEGMAPSRAQLEQLLHTLPSDTEIIM